MAVSTSVVMDPGGYVPLMQKVRFGPNGLVGTYSKSFNTTGAAGGGGVTISVTATRQMFGFAAIIVPTLIVSLDTLATPEGLRFLWIATGNRRVRLQADITQVITPVTVASINLGRLDVSGIMIEGRNKSEQNVFQAIWPTNTDGKIYQIKMFAMVYDAEMLEKHGQVAGLLEGIR